MSKKKKVQIIAVLFLVLAVMLLIPNTNWSDRTSLLGFISLVVGTLGSIISIFIPTNYTFNFKESDWKQDIQNGGYNLLITAKKHGIGRSPQAQTFQNNEKAYEEVIVNSKHDSDGNITIGANSIFCGKVIIT